MISFTTHISSRVGQGLLILCLWLCCPNVEAQQSSQAAPVPTIQIALLKYHGGGDWYSVADAIPNITRFCNEKLHMNMVSDYAAVDVGSPEIFNYPFLFITGHGNIELSQQEAENLRQYLLAGGFLYVDDDFGLDPFIRPVFKQLFPDMKMVELPFDYPIYHQKYDFNSGPPKIHKHLGLPPQGFGIFDKDRLMIYYTYESNVSDGWDSHSVHNDPEEIRQKALKMGANIFQFAFSQP